MNAIILHGMPSKEDYYNPEVPSQSNSHWLPWLQQQLIICGIKADTPEMPKAYDPEWNTWVKEVERFEIGHQTMLVGHSCGGGFWVRYLSEKPKLKVGKVVLVAPWLDPDGDETKGFFDFEIDPTITKRTAGLYLCNSDNDMGNVHKSVANLREKLDSVTYQEFHRYGHFCTGDRRGMDKFPELLELLVSAKEAT